MSEINFVSSQNTNISTNDSTDKFAASVSQEQNAGYGLSDEDLKGLYSNNSVDENTYGDEPFDNALALGPLAVAVPAVVSWLSSPIVGAGVSVGGAVVYNAVKSDDKSFETSNLGSTNPNETGFQAEDFGQAKSLDFPSKSNDNSVSGFQTTENENKGSEFPSIPNQGPEVSGTLGNSEFGNADMKEAKSYWDRLAGDTEVKLDGTGKDEGFVMRADVDIIVQGGQVSIPGGGGFEAGSFGKTTSVAEFWGPHADEIKTNSVDKILEELAINPDETVIEHKQRLDGETWQQFYKRMEREGL